MERFSMFPGRKNQYCENNYTTKYSLQIQCNPYQITNGIFQRTRTKNFTIHMETQKTPKSQSSLEKEELEESSFLTSDYTTKLQSSRQYGTGTKIEKYTLGESSREAQSGRRLLGTNGVSLWLWCCLPQPGALTLIPSAQRSPASSVLAREGAGCGSVGDVPGAWLASAPLWPSLWT